MGREPKTLFEFLKMLSPNATHIIGHRHGMSRAYFICHLCRDKSGYHCARWPPTREVEEWVEMHERVHERELARWIGEGRRMDSTAPEWVRRALDRRDRDEEKDEKARYKWHLREAAKFTPRPHSFDVEVRSISLAEQCGERGTEEG